MRQVELECVEDAADQHRRACFRLPDELYLALRQEGQDTTHEQEEAAAVRAAIVAQDVEAHRATLAQERAEVQRTCSSRRTTQSEYQRQLHEKRVARQRGRSRDQVNSLLADLSMPARSS